MKRRVGFIFCLLLLGAVVNVAVGWACALVVPFPKESSTRSQPTQAEIDQLPREWRHPYRQVDHVSYERSLAQAFGKTVQGTFVRYRTGLEHTLGRNHGLIDYACGWPLPSLGGNALLDDVYYLTPATIEAKSKWFGAVRMPKLDERSGMDPLRLGPAAVAIPYRPLWPGFAINTIFYAILFAAPFTIAGPVRRFLRLRAGLCPACKYPIGGSPVCSECGTTLPPARRTIVS